MPKTAGFWRWVLLVPWLILASGALFLLQFGRPTAGPPASPANPGPSGLVLRYRLDPDRFIRVEISPGTPGPNAFRATVLNRDLQPLAAAGLSLRLWRLDRDDPPVELRPDVGQPRFQLEPGWWAVEAGLAGGPTQTFYLQVGPANSTASDPAAVDLLNRAVDTFGQLTTVRWEEQLTSGLPYPTAAGGWVLTEGEAQAPNRIHLKLNLDGSTRETYQVGDRRCDRDDSGPWRCADAPPVNPFDRAAFRSAAGVSLGRRETVGDELARVVFFYLPPAESWYAWWVGEQSGRLLQEAMVTPGHIMVSRYFNHNAPLHIELPAGA